MPDEEREAGALRATTGIQEEQDGEEATCFDMPVPEPYCFIAELL